MATGATARLVGVLLKILILKPSSLGDVVQALPVLRLLKRHFPSSEIHWWIESRFAGLLEDDPDLSGLVRFERRRWAAARHWPELWRSVLGLREQRFDWVIDLQCLARSATMGWLANGDFFIGLDETREGARGFYDLAVPRPEGTPHAVDRYLAVLDRLGVPRHWNFDWLPARPGIAAEVARRWPATRGRWVILQPGARWPNKRWPVEYFSELARLLAGHFPEHRFAILGAAEDHPLGETIARAAPEQCLDLTGRLTLPEMIEWIRLSELMVTNDTGPMHVAAALGKRLVALFGPTDPRRTGPYGQLDHVLRLDLPCSPCLKPRCAYFQPFECLRGLKPAVVLEAVEKRLSAN
jgi:lipopolysaccharide heptosyltransferase I